MANTIIQNYQFKCVVKTNCTKCIPQSISIEKKHYCNRSEDSKKKKKRAKSFL